MLLLQDCTGEMQAEHATELFPSSDKFLLQRRALKEEIQLVHNAIVNQPTRTLNYLMNRQLKYFS